MIELTNARHHVARISTGLSMMLVMVLVHPAATAAVLAVNLGTASGFAVLAGSTITNTGTTTIHGDVGLDPGSAITGFGSVVLDGTTHVNDVTAIGATVDLAAAYTDAAGRTPDTSYSVPTDLTGTLVSGVYQASGTSFGIPGDLTLDGDGDPNAVWIFQAGSTLITTAGSRIILTNGAQAGNVFWQVGSSATLGADSNLAGSILALTSISLNAGATVDGRVLAQNGAVTMIGNLVTVPEPGSTLLSGFGMAGLFAFRRRVVARS